MTKELKACPFCNQLPTYSKTEGWQRCDCARTTMSTDDWNNRPIENALTAENKKFRKALEKIVREYDGNAVWCFREADRAIMEANADAERLANKPTKSRETEPMNENIQLADKNAKLRDLLDKLLDEYSFMSDRYWDSIYPSPPSKEISGKHNGLIKAVREALNHE